MTYLIIAIGYRLGSMPLASWWLGLPGQLITYSIALPGLVGVTQNARTRQKALRPA